MKAHIFLPDRTHKSIPASLTVFYGNPCVLQNFIATVNLVFMTDDTIIATVNHCFMPEITHNATVTYEFISAGTCSRCAVLGVVFTDSPLICA